MVWLCSVLGLSGIADLIIHRRIWSWRGSRITALTWNGEKLATASGEGVTVLDPATGTQDVMLRAGCYLLAWRGDHLVTTTAEAVLPARDSDT